MTPQPLRRKFDHDQARERYANGETVAALARSYGVAEPSIKRVVDDEYRKRQNEYQREWQKTRPKRVRATTEARRKTMRDRARLLYATDPKYREKQKARARHEPLLNRRARQQVYVAIRRGDLVRPDQCEQCGASSYCEAAHHDYNLPLAVRWLCRTCHRRWDASEPKTRTI